MIDALHLSNAPLMIQHSNFKKGTMRSLIEERNEWALRDGMERFVIQRELHLKLHDVVERVAGQSSFCLANIQNYLSLFVNFWSF